MISHLDLRKYPYCVRIHPDYIEKCLRARIWCQNNINGLWSYDGLGYFGFEDPEDAMQFKLVWL